MDKLYLIITALIAFVLISVVVVFAITGFKSAISKGIKIGKKYTIDEIAEMCKGNVEKPNKKLIGEYIGVNYKLVAYEINGSIYFVPISVNDSSNQSLKGSGQ
jgi:hypothetical protein